MEAAVWMVSFLKEPLPLIKQPFVEETEGVLFFVAVPNLCSNILTNMEWKLSTSLKPTGGISMVIHY